VPPATLTRGQIVKAAVDLLDEAGLEGLNMRALGKRLGTVPTAVYWHVKNKTDLITLAGDQVWKEIALPDLTGTDWRRAATAMATDFRAMLIRHPWLIQVFGSYVVFGPNRARHNDHSLAIFEAGGFTGASVVQAATTVSIFVVGSALGPAGEAALRRSLRRLGGDADARIRDTIAKTREVAQQFRHLRAYLDARVATNAGLQETFEFGLRAVLDGLESQRRALR